MKITKEEFREIMTEIGWLHEGWTNRLYDKLVESDRAKGEPARVSLSDEELRGVWARYTGSPSLDNETYEGKIIRLIREAESKHGDEPIQDVLIPDHSRNWEEDYPHENGQYQNICRSCGNNFWGHKRRILCKVCETAKPVANPLPDRRAELLKVAKIALASRAMSELTPDKTLIGILSVGVAIDLIDSVDEEMGKKNG